MEHHDEELMLLFQQGDSQALHELFTRYQRPVFNFSLRILNNRADAEDVTAEVFMKLCEKKHYYQPQAAKFSTWLFTIAYNTSVSRARNRRNTVSLWRNTAGQENTEEVAWEVPSQDPLPSQNLIQREEIRQVRLAILKLPRLQKEAVILREYHQFSYQEISQIMNCSLEQVKILIFRAREFLRQELPVTEEDKNA